MTQFQIESGILTKAYKTDSISYVIPEEVTLINDSDDYETSVFYDLRDEEFKLSFAANSQLTKIGKYAFGYCKKLKSIDFTNAVSLKTICLFSFAYCESLTELHFPSSLEEFDGYGSFSGCYSVKTITFPDKCAMTTICSGAFTATQITAFRIPCNCRSINGEAFALTLVESFTIEEGNVHFMIYEGSVFNYQLTKLIVCRKGGTAVFPDQMTAIGDLAFHYYRGDLVLSKNVTIVGSWPFLGYMGKYITINGAIDTLYNRSFESCRNLIEVRFFGEIGTIQADAFVYCYSLRRVFLVSINYMVKEAFPNINRICFHGNVTALNNLLQDKMIKQCIVSNEKLTCKGNRVSLFAKTILVLMITYY